MGRLFTLIAMLIALYIGMTIYTEGIDRTFDGVFAPLESVRSGETPLATHLTPSAQMAEEPSRRARPRTRIGDAVHQRVSADLREAARRRGYDPD